MIYSAVLLPGQGGGEIRFFLVLLGTCKPCRIRQQAITWLHYMKEGNITLT